MPDLLTPPLVLVAAAVVVALLPRAVGAPVFVAAPLAAGAALAGLGRSAEVSATVFGQELVVLRLDSLSLPFAWVFVAATLLAAIYGLQTTTPFERGAALLAAAGGMGVVLAGDLLTLFVYWEVKAVASAVLIWQGGRAKSTAAGMRYLFVHLAGGTVLLAGILWYVTQTGSLRFDLLDTGVAGTLVLIGFVLAAGVPPLHAWLADGYPESTVAGTVFLSAFTTKAAVYALARGFPGVEVLVWAGVAMALYGVVYAVLENDIRRLLAYHIVSQVGYMVAAVGIGTPEAINGATAHAFAHVLYKGLLLMGAGAVLYATGRSKLTELGGIVRAMPVVFAFYMIGAFAISSVPGFSGFAAKELAVEAASLDGRTAVLLLLKLASVGTFLHTGLKLPYFTWLGPSRGVTPTRVPVTMIVAMGLGAAANIVLGVMPQIMYDLLPHPVTYAPFTPGKILETSQLLAFTAVGFWLLRNRVGGIPMVSIDTDWVYRRLPKLVAARTAPVTDRVRERVGGISLPPVEPARLLRYRGGRPGEPSWLSMQLLGATIVVAFVILLGVALIR